MRHTRYLNVILTINAVLLAGLVWSQVAGWAPLAQTASAQVGTPGVPNAGLQRQQIMLAIVDLDKRVAELQKALTGGKVKVEVTNLDQIQLEDNGD